MAEMIHMAADWILLIAAVLMAVTNIAKFLGHPIKFARNRQDKMIDERAKAVLIDTLKGNEEKIKTEIVDLVRKELPEACSVSHTMREEILPTLQEIKEINLDQNGRIDILFDTSKDVLREKIMGIYHTNKANKSLKIYEKEALDQYYKDYKKENGNSYIDRYYNRMCTWEVVNSQYDKHYLD